MTTSPSPRVQQDPPLVQRVEIEGRPATAEQLLWPALVNDGHFTAMQVRAGRVRGLGLHLARLDSATRELFDRGLDGGRVRELVRHALGDDITDAAIRVYVHAPDGEPRIMVTVRPPAGMPADAQSLMSVPYLRPVPHIKHVGGFGQIHYGRLARRAGFDGALLTGPDGTVSEGAVANIAFYDGSDVVWPDAPCLAGTTLQLLEPRLGDAGLRSRRAPVGLADLASYPSAFVMNSLGIAPVRRIDATDFTVDEKLMGVLADVYASVPWEAL
ncbi:aminotransferase class IV family protein [Streptomyces sp. PSKA54]|uniref:Aminotransferase class IV family protein n=1 Tax=Streptomyces himalayensis subsp. aureolus TaxID=2758039 RepID=A0A7W2D3Y1_9ACTN|nr:aminotransferase class IV family protein [Streptomyces himalayensis]MBA4864318.1 aminotransferase class IV family protein [Streptomyces himalayensis subsp. aureolus]